MEGGWRAIPVSDGSQALLNSNNCSSSNCCSNSKQYLFESIAIVTDSKKLKKWKSSISKALITHDLNTPLGRSPANFGFLVL